jgi:hypothetical protein
MKWLWAAALAVVATAGGAEEATVARGAMLRALDKTNGKVEDFNLLNGEVATLGRIRISLGECRYPEGNPAGDAFAFVAITEEGAGDPVFMGWMIASSPALNAVEHPRYDVWVRRCITE